MSDNGWMLIVQAAACAASYALQEQETSSKKSNAGRVAIRRAQRSVRKISAYLVQFISVCVLHVV